ncbi:MAG TPA: S8 family serine peptidase [Terriglobales bacterium]|nr:S8 family serine peptidase [Terriglobales bacterium]
MGAPVVTRRAARTASAGALTGLLFACVLAAAAAPMPASADTVRDNEWALAALQVPQAWATTRGEGVTVGVLDSGVDGGHPDLSGQVTTGPDLVGGDARPGDPYWGQHGTAMASTIAGHGHGPTSGAGVIGVAPSARLLSVRVTWDNNDPIRSMPPSARAAAGAKAGNPVADGIRYAVDHGAQVINMSFGEAVTTATRVPETDAAVEYAVAHGVVLVASTGNGAQTTNAAELPAAIPGVIAVAATDRSGRRATFSTHLWMTSVAAPGVEVIEAQAGGGYLVGDGTSPAAALVSGVVALIRSKFPKLTPAQVRDVLQRTASHPAGGYSEDVGWGVVQAAGALRMAATLTPDAALPLAVPGRSRLLGGGAGGGAPKVGLRALDVRALALPLVLLPASSVLLMGAVLLVAVRPRRRSAGFDTMDR